MATSGRSSGQLIVNMHWWNRIKERIALYSNIEEASEWLERNQFRVGARFQRLFAALLRI